MSRIGITLVIYALAVPIIISAQVPPGTSPDGSNKCGNCPCNNPCTVPPPPPPSPPPPELPPPPPPPAPPKKPPSPKCPPPPGSPSLPGEPTGPTPPSQYIYVTGPPGDLYPVDTNSSGAFRSFNVGLPILLIVKLTSASFMVNFNWF